MTAILEAMPSVELEQRHTRLRRVLAELCPAAGGLLVFSPLNIYYLTGTLPAGVLWLPLEGEPVLLVRKGLERARMESPLRHIHAFKSYSALAEACAQSGSPLGSILAAEMSGLSWSMAEMLKARLATRVFVDGSAALVRARAIKTPYELEKLRIGGARHEASYLALHEQLAAGMSERQIAVAIWNEFFRRGHAGALRLSALGGEVFLGQLAVGDNANYPTFWDGPVGYRGGHPAVPVMGNAHSLWQPGTPLVIDAGFSYEGYHTDKTQVFWAGPLASIPAEVRRAHDVCVDIQTSAAAAMKPGVTPESLWHMAVAKVAKAGFTEGFMGLGDNKVHFLGHGIGLAYDEYPPLANRFVAPFEEGMVIAIEPKIGISGLGMVGLENVYEVTPSGAVSLTGTMHDIVPVTV